MSAESRNPHDDLIRFLEEHDSLIHDPKFLSGDPYAAAQDMMTLVDDFEVDNSEGQISGVTIFEPVVFTRREKIIIADGSRIDSFVKIEGGEGVLIGRCVHIASFAHLNIGGGTLVIQEFAAVASGAKLISGSNEIDAVSMSASAPEELQRVHKQSVTLMRFSCVLTNAVVLPGVTLHEGAILAAGGVATRDIPAWEIWGGVPARFIAKRVVVHGQVAL